MNDKGLDPLSFVGINFLLTTLWTLTNGAGCNFSSYKKSGFTTGTFFCSVGILGILGSSFCL